VFRAQGGQLRPIVVLGADQGLDLRRPGVDVARLVLAERLRETRPRQTVVVGQRLGERREPSMLRRE